MTPTTQPPGEEAWPDWVEWPLALYAHGGDRELSSKQRDDYKQVVGEVIPASHASALQDELDALREKAGQLWQRVAEQQNVETVYGQGEASDEEMFTATAAAYSAANRLHRLLSTPINKESTDEGPQAEEAERDG